MTSHRLAKSISAVAWPPPVEGRTGGAEGREPTATLAGSGTEDVESGRRMFRHLEASPLGRPGSQLDSGRKRA